MSASKHQVYGIHAIEQLLHTQPERVIQLWQQQGKTQSALTPLLKLAHTQGISVQSVSKQTLDKQTHGGVHQGILAVCRPIASLSDKDLPILLDNIVGNPLILVLDGITDPHNLGACLRTADAAGVHLVIAPKDKSAPLNDTAAKVASGAANSMPYVQVTNLARTLEELKQRGIWLVGAAGEAKQSVYQQELKGALALIMGAEGSGLRRLTKSACDYLLHIPMAGAVSSLNVSVATGVCLFEIVRQKHD